MASRARDRCWPPPAVRGWRVRGESRHLPTEAHCPTLAFWPMVAARLREYWKLLKAPYQCPREEAAGGRGRLGPPVANSHRTSRGPRRG
eukprot:9296142-Pyramimonas_sp.AAC.1